MTFQIFQTYNKKDTEMTLPLRLDTELKRAAITGKNPSAYSENLIFVPEFLPAVISQISPMVEFASLTPHFYFLMDM